MDLEIPRITGTSEFTGNESTSRITVISEQITDDPAEVACIERHGQEWIRTTEGVSQ